MSPAVVRTSASLRFVSFTNGLSTAIYRGTVNDPTPFPTPSKTHGSYHWAFERILSAGLVPLTVASFVTSGTNYPILDGLLGVSLVMHSHIGVRIFLSFHSTYSGILHTPRLRYSCPFCGLLSPSSRSSPSHVITSAQDRTDRSTTVRRHPRGLPSPTQVPRPRPCPDLGSSRNHCRRPRRRISVQHERHRYATFLSPRPHLAGLIRFCPARVERPRSNPV